MLKQLCHPEYQYLNLIKNIIKNGEKFKVEMGQQKQSLNM